MMLLFTKCHIFCKKDLEILNISLTFISKTRHVLSFQMVRDENLKFMKNRDVYSSDYFSFVLSLASLNAVSDEFYLSDTK